MSDSEEHAWQEAGERACGGAGHDAQAGDADRDLRHLFDQVADKLNETVDELRNNDRR